MIAPLHGKCSARGVCARGVGLALLHGLDGANWLLLLLLLLRAWGPAEFRRFRRISGNLLSIGVSCVC